MRAGMIGIGLANHPRSQSPCTSFSREALTSKATTCRKLIITNSSSSPDDLTDQARKLDKLFYSTTASAPDDPALSDPTPDLLQTPTPATPPGIISDLPLWRVQWCVMPGYQEVLHVHVPHYCDLFNRLFSQPGPWRFGHLMLPGGSANLGAPEYALIPGSQAPLIGTLMEVLQAVRFPDGRILMLAVGLGRFKVLEALQSVPHSRATISLLPDAEEITEWEPTATSGLDSCSDNDIPMMAALEASASAARAASTAAAATWWEWELSRVRVHDRLALIDARDEGTAQDFGRRLVTIGSNEVLSLPSSLDDSNYDDILEEKVQKVTKIDDDSEEMGGVVIGGDPSLDDATVAASAAARQAVEDVIEKLTGLRPNMSTDPNSNTPPSPLGSSMNTGLGLLGGDGSSSNTTNDRGIPSQSATEAAGFDPEQDMNLPDTIESALQLESKVWEELEAVNLLAEKLSGRKPVLPQGLISLLPPFPLSSFRSSLSRYHQGAPEKYPALRRAQRLSHAIATVLGDVNASEGRQAFLEAGSITARLKMGLATLRKHRKTLAALTAVQTLEQDEGGDAGKN